MSAAAGAATNDLYEQVADRMREFVRDSVINHPKLDPKLKALIENPDNTYAARAFFVGLRPQNVHHASWNEHPMLDKLLESVLLNIPSDYPGRAEKLPKFEANLRDVFKDILTYDTLRKGIVLESLRRNPDMVAVARSVQFKHKYASPSAPTPYPSPEFAAGADEPAPQVDPELDKVIDQLISDLGIPKGAAFPQNKGAQNVIEQGFRGGRRTKKYKKRTRRRRSTSRRPRA